MEGAVREENEKRKRKKKRSRIQQRGIEQEEKTTVQVKEE
jgi:hypothetical protein